MRATLDAPHPGRHALPPYLEKPQPLLWAQNFLPQPLHAYSVPEQPVFPQLWSEGEVGDGSVVSDA
jgi:hypothetical protein